VDFWRATFYAALPNFTDLTLGEKIKKKYSEATVVNILSTEYAVYIDVEESEIDCKNLCRGSAYAPLTKC
jgi:hypothetical protein